MTIMLLTPADSALLQVVLLVALLPAALHAHLIMTVLSDMSAIITLAFVYFQAVLLLEVLPVEVHHQVDLQAAVQEDNLLEIV